MHESIVVTGDNLTTRSLMGTFRLMPTWNAVPSLKQLRLNFNREKKR